MGKQAAEGRGLARRMAGEKDSKTEAREAEDRRRFRQERWQDQNPLLHVHALQPIGCARHCSRPTTAGGSTIAAAAAAAHVGMVSRTVM